MPNSMRHQQWWAWEGFFVSRVTYKVFGAISHATFWLLWMEGNKIGFDGVETWNLNWGIKRQMALAQDLILLERGGFLSLSDWCNQFCVYPFYGLQLDLVGCFLGIHSCDISYNYQYIIFSLSKKKKNTEFDQVERLQTTKPLNLQRLPYPKEITILSAQISSTMQVHQVYPFIYCRCSYDFLKRLHYYSQGNNGDFYSFLTSYRFDYQSTKISSICCRGFRLCERAYSSHQWFQARRQYLVVPYT